MAALPTVPCARCGDSIMWAITERGRRMPLDPEPNPRGNVSLVITREGLRAQVVSLVSADNQEGLYMPHFATCGSAKRRWPALKVVS